MRKRLPSGPGPDMFASDFKARIQRTANNGHTTTETKVAEPRHDPLMQEIEDELRQEQMKKMWAVYGKYVIGIVVAVVITVAGYQGWQAYDASRKQDATDTLLGAATLAQNGDNAAATDILSKLESDAPSGVAMLAKMRKAGLQAETGDAAAAADLYATVAADTSAPKAFRELATILGAVQSLEANPGSAQSVLDSLAPLRGETDTWRHAAREISAAAALELGNTEMAREFLQANALDGRAPGGVRSRAQELLQALAR